jgi:hypothetical protein
LIGKPFEIADAQALLKLFEAALTGVMRRPTALTAVVVPRR